MPHIKATRGLNPRLRFQTRHLRWRRRPHRRPIPPPLHPSSTRRRRVHVILLRHVSIHTVAGC
ncbi:hypothetical protein LINPERPRIM_LOCUS39878 [Linum perenne]